MIAFSVATFIIVILDLVEGIISILHFDDTHGSIVFLTASWVFYALVDNVCAEVSRCTKCHWDDCALKCMACVGQCGLYIHLCSKDSGVDIPLITLCAIQLLLKVSSTMCQACHKECVNQKDEPVESKANCSNSVLDSADSVVIGKPACIATERWESEERRLHQEVTNMAVSCSESPWQPWAKMFLRAAFSALGGVLLMLFQEESPFRTQWFEMIFCVHAWMPMFTVRCLRQLNEKVVRCLSICLILQTLAYGVFVWTLCWIWGLSDHLNEQFDRVYTLAMMIITGIFFCWCCWCSCCCLAVGNARRGSMEKVDVAYLSYAT